MLAEMLKHPRALVLSLLLHLGVIALMVLNLSFIERPKQIKAGQMAQTVQAEMIDLNQLKQQEKQKQLEADRKAEAEKKKKAEADKKKKAEADKKKAEADKKKKAEADKKKKAEADKKKKAEADKKKAEADKKKAEADKKKAEADKKKAEADKKKRQAEEKRKAEEARIVEEKRKAEEARIAEEKRKAEEARIAEEKRKAEAARIAAEKRKAEEEQRRKEADLKARLLTEENQRRLNSLRQRYIVAITQKIQRNWIKPPGSDKITPCKIQVTQAPGGIILNVRFGSCGENNATYRKSIENAVYKADPLPLPEDPELFDRDLNILFNPSGQ